MRQRLPVWPVSTGRNWGLGSRIPPSDGDSVVHLSLLARIRTLDTDNGIAVVEPGVTQAQLARAIAGTGWMVNLTGSCAGTSIVGNTAAAGDGVIRPRRDDVAGTETVTPAGTVEVTGVLAERCPDADPAWPRHGIVTALAVRLTPVPEDLQIVHAHAAGPPAAVVAALRRCILEASPGAMPRLYSGGVIVPILGTRESVRKRATAAASILRSTRGLSAVRVVSAATVPAQDSLHLVGMLLRGEPTCEMVRESFGLQCARVDRWDRGWLLVLPLLSPATETVARAARIWQHAARRAGIPVAAEVIMVSPEVAHAVLQITFDADQAVQAHTLKDSLAETLARNGMPPYRIGIDHPAG
jgi:4-cresol dehydrogenase (hydroxylating)